MSGAGPGATSPARARRERGALESLGAIVLGFELIIVFLAALVLWGLSPAPFGEDGIPAWVALVGGGVVVVVLIAAVGLLARPIGVWLGWLVQLALLAAGFLNPALFIVGGLFAAMWAYCVVTGQRLDRRRAAVERAASEEPGEPGRAASPLSPPSLADPNEPRKDTP